MNTETGSFVHNGVVYQYVSEVLVGGDEDGCRQLTITAPHGSITVLQDYETTEELVADAIHMLNIAPF